MKKLSPILLILTLLYACGNERSSSGLPVAGGNNSAGQQNTDNNKADEQLELSYPPYISFPESECVIFPVALYNPQAKSALSVLHSGGYDYESYERKEPSGGYGNFANLLFYNIKTKQKYLLAEETFFISSLEGPVIYPADSSRFFLLYAIQKKDLNKDGILGRGDPKALYLSDVNGKNLMALTPDHEEFQSWSLVPGHNYLFARTIRDTNKDSEFDTKDEKIIYKINLANPKEREEIFDDSLKKKLSKLVLGR